MPIFASTSRYIADHLIFAGGLFAGSQLPVFIGQYRQRVGGMLDQAKIDLQPFQAIADTWHGGSLDALIQHHLNSSDPTFYAEGEAISAIAASVARLSESYTAMAGGLMQQLPYLATHYDSQLAAATWQAFTPGVSFSAAAIVFALLAGYSLSLLFRGCLVALGQLKRLSPAAKRQEPSQLEQDPKNLARREPEPELEPELAEPLIDIQQLPVLPDETR